MVYFSGKVTNIWEQILCVQGSSDGPEQYVAIMNSIFSAQRSMVPIDSCYIGSNNSAFLQQASYITGGVYQKPQQLDGLFQYLSEFERGQENFYGFWTSCRSVFGQAQSDVTSASNLKRKTPET
ncbi:general transcription and DNA repair factor IIH subunit TFB4-like [Quercus robur]|uniref:general transcription and DNA repair factor IIH subunit TFB4-like n=1 Tax=Quercus lobata TaxID=97700 RepID=UPI001245FBA6|nr:general transcription and DNA repair factor IIH subunit TFB4-like [Quercus lobata]XP_050255133.1 general transcription and DNA repair factor IIH subunit TFB4-like [Quercus robur]